MPLFILIFGVVRPQVSQVSDFSKQCILMFFWDTGPWDLGTVYLGADLEIMLINAHPTSPTSNNFQTKRSWNFVGNF